MRVEYVKVTLPLKMPLDSSRTFEVLTAEDFATPNTKIVLYY